MDANKLHLFIKRRRKKFTYALLTILFIILCHLALKKHAKHTKSMSHRSDATCSAFFIVLSFRILFDSSRPMWIPKKTKELIRNRLTPYTKKPKRSIYIDTDLSPGGLPLSMLKHTSIHGGGGDRECGYVWAFDKDDSEVKYDTCSDHSLENSWKFCRLPAHLISRIRTGGVESLNEYCMPNIAVSWPLHGEGECLDSGTDVDGWVGYAKSLDKDLINDVVSKLVGYPIISWQVLGLLVDYDKRLLDSGLSIFNNTTPLYAETKFNAGSSNLADSVKYSSVQTRTSPDLGKTRKSMSVMSEELGTEKATFITSLMRDITSESEKDINSVTQPIKRNRRHGFFSSEPDKHENYITTESNDFSEHVFPSTSQSNEIVDKILSAFLTTISSETLDELLKAQDVESTDESEKKKLFESFLREIYPEFFSATETHEAISATSIDESTKSYDEMEGSAIDEVDITSDQLSRTNTDYDIKRNLNKSGDNIPSKSTLATSSLSRINHSPPIMEYIRTTVGELQSITNIQLFNSVDGSALANIVQSTDSYSSIITTTMFSSQKPDQSKNEIINPPNPTGENKLLISSHDIELFKSLLYKIYHVLVSGTVPVSILSDEGNAFDQSATTVSPDYSESTLYNDFDSTELQTSLQAISPISELSLTSKATAFTSSRMLADITSDNSVSSIQKDSQNGQGNQYSATDVSIENSKTPLGEEHVSHRKESSLSSDENKETDTQNTGYTISIANEEPQELTVQTTGEIQSGTIINSVTPGIVNSLGISDGLRTTENILLPSTSISLYSSIDSNIGIALSSTAALPVTQSSSIAVPETNFSTTMTDKTSEDLIATTLNPKDVQHSNPTPQMLPNKVNVGSVTNTIQTDGVEQNTVSEIAVSKAANDATRTEYTREFSLTTLANSSSSIMNLSKENSQFSSVQANLASSSAAPIAVSQLVEKPDQVKSLDIGIMPRSTNAFSTATQSSSTLEQNLKSSSSTAAGNSSPSPISGEKLHSNIQFSNTSSHTIIAASENITSPKESTITLLNTTTFSTSHVVTDNLTMSENLSLPTADTTLRARSNDTLVDQTELQLIGQDNNTGVFENVKEIQSHSVSSTEQQVSTLATKTTTSLQSDASGSGSGGGFSMSNKLASSTAVNHTSIPEVGLAISLVDPNLPIANSTLDEVKSLPTELSSVSLGVLDERAYTVGGTPESKEKNSTVETPDMSSSNFHSTSPTSHAIKVTSVSNEEDKTNVSFAPLVTNNVQYRSTTSPKVTSRDSLVNTIQKSSQLPPSTVQFPVSHSGTEPEDPIYTSAAEEAITLNPTTAQSSSPDTKTRAATDNIQYITSTSSTETFGVSLGNTTEKSSQLPPSTVQFPVSHSGTEPEDPIYTSAAEEAITSSSTDAKTEAVQLPTKNAIFEDVHLSKTVPSTTITNINPKPTSPTSSTQSSSTHALKDKFVPVVEISTAIMGKWFQYNLTTVWTDKLIKNKSLQVNVTTLNSKKLQSVHCDLITTEWLNFNSELNLVSGVPVSKNCSHGIFQISTFMISLTDDSNNMVVPPINLHVSLYPLIEDALNAYEIVTEVDLVLQGSGEWKMDEINEKAPAAFITALYSYFKSKIPSVLYSSFSILNFLSVSDSDNETVSHIFPVQIRWNIDNITTSDFENQFEDLLVDSDTNQMSYDFFIAMLPSFIVTDIEVIETSQYAAEMKQPTVDTILSGTGTMALATVLPPTLLGLCLLITCVALIFVRKRKGPVYHVSDRLFDKTFGPNRKPIYLDHDIEMDCFESSQNPVTPLEYTSDYAMHQDSSFTLSEPSTSTSGGGSYSSSCHEKPSAINPSRVRRTGTGSSTLRFDDIFKVQSQEASFTPFSTSNFVFTNPAFYLSNEGTSESQNN